MVYSRNGDAEGETSADQFKTILNKALSWTTLDRVLDDDDVTTIMTTDSRAGSLYSSNGTTLTIEEMKQFWFDVVYYGITLTLADAETEYNANK